MRKATIALSVLIGLAAIAGGGWWRHRATQPIELALYFHPFVGSERLTLNEARYPNPGGEGRFKVRDFQLFLSNIRLAGESGEFIEPDSYHLVRFDGAEPAFAIVLHGVPRRDYQRIEFGIGVDPAANTSLTQRGDLDPNGRMAWTWEVGYKFVLLEGTLERGDTSVPLVYHVGFDENYKPVTMALQDGLLKSRSTRLDFRVDLSRLFQGSSTVDMAALPSVKFDRTDARLLARNFAGMITPMRAEALDRKNYSLLPTCRPPRSNTRNSARSPAAEVGLIR